MEHRLPNNLNVSFSNLDGDELLMAIDDVALSSGAACTSADRAPSHVLRALGLDDELARASLRFGLGRWTTEAEIDYVAKKVTDVVRQLAGNVPTSAVVRGRLSRIEFRQAWCSVVLVRSVELR